MKDLIHSFDRVVGDWVAALPRWLRPLMLLFTLIGQPPFTVGVAAAVLGYGAALNKPIYIAAGLVSLITLAAVSLLKLVLRRARPRNNYSKNMWFKSFSFPSGHAAGSLVSFVMAALIIGNKWPEFAVTALVVAIIGCFFIALSRIYLGAHYASDIIGGWIVGGVGLAVVIYIVK
jgi:membrane-associated phospholipid phosphatase